MPTEIKTFSSAVDDAISRAGRPDRKLDIISHIRLTMRECQVLAYFESDRIEDTIVANADPYVYSTPQRFRIMEAVQYPGIIDEQGNPIYADPVSPGRKQREHKYFYYISGASHVFAGHGANASLNASINLSYFSYFAPLPYYDDADRPAKFILEDDAWSYLTATTDDEKEAAQALVTNWLLTRHYDTVIEGTLAKLYKMNDDARAGSTFGLYKLLQTTLLHAESRAAIGGHT